MIDINYTCSYFMNCTETIGQTIITGTETTTGSLYITLLMILVLILIFCILFSIPLEWIAILTFPFVLAYMAFYSSFLKIGLVIILYLAFILTKNFLLS